MKKYYNQNDGEIYTEKQLKDFYCKNRDDLPYYSFSDFLDSVLAYGEKDTGIVEY